MENDYRKNPIDTYNNERYIDGDTLEHMDNPIDQEIRTVVNAESSLKYDDHFILKRLMEGKTRDEIADELNHRNYRTLDMYMRRKGYIWDSYRQIYIIKPTNEDEDDFQVNSSKAQRIISLFGAGYDPLEIAKRVGMKDHRTIALYMKNKGYVWSSSENNYILQKGERIVENSPSNSHTEGEIKEDQPLPTEVRAADLNKLEQLIPMLQMIDRNKEKLAELLAINGSGTIPRYVVGGITITKSLCMSHHLSDLVKEFSKEKNISQREIFEVAIVEFLKKYGYENEIHALFSR